MPTADGREPAQAAMRNQDSSKPLASDGQHVQSLLSGIVESSDDAIITKDFNGFVTSWNNAAERIFGYTAEEIIGRPISLLIPHDRLNEEPAILERIRRGERIEHYQTIRLRKDGAEVHVSLTVSPVRDANGRVVGASKIVRDITGQIRALEELRRSEERFRVTLASIGDAVIATDVQGRITFMNPVAERLTGWSEQESLSKPLELVFDITNEVTGIRAENPIMKVLQQGTIVGLANHTALRSKDGSLWPIGDSAAPIQGTNGITGVVLVFRETTQQRAAELTAQRLAAIVESAEDAIVSKDLQGIVMSWNRAAERIFGYTAEEMIGRSITVLFPPDRVEEEQHILARLQAGQRVDHFETVRMRKNGELLDVSLTISPIRSSAGEIIGASKIARDITEKRRAERALQEAQLKLQTYAQQLEERVAERTADLQRALTELESFSYSVSHDMRAPLRGMQQYAQALLQDFGPNIPPEGQRYVERIISSAARLEVLIRDVLSYSQVLRSPIKLQPVQLEPLVASVIQNHPNLQPPQAHIEVITPLLPVQGHEVFLTQCLSNLLSNAVKFVQPECTPAVRVWTESVGSNVRLLVRDNGIGISPEHHARLFGMFERIQKDKRYEGTGIGLVIVRKAAERMQGRVGFESAPGQGSTFWIELGAA